MASSIQPDGLQVDSFVFWGGRPAFESLQTPLTSRWFRIFSSWTVRKYLARLQEKEEEYTNVPEISALPLVEGDRILRRQIRRNKRNQFENKSSNAPKRPEPREQLSASSTRKAKIGFHLHLTTCDKEEITKWINVWKEQAVDQTFLFTVLLSNLVEANCVSEMKSHFTMVKDSGMIFEVFQKDEMVFALHACKTPNKVLESSGLDELIFYDASTARGQQRSSVPLRQVRISDSVASSFRCLGEPQQPNYCSGYSVIDCYDFQYVSQEPKGSAEEIMEAKAF